MSDSLRTQLEQRGLRVTGDGSPTVTSGQGLMRRTVTLDTTPAPDADRRTVTAYSRGVLAALSEPKNSKASAFDFIECTSRLFPTLEAPGFEAGARAAGVEDPWLRDGLDDLKLAYFIELDSGLRLLTEGQVAQWDVHPERIEKAAESILFHKTGYERWRAVDTDIGPVREYRLGDMCDAARGLLLDRFDFHAARSGLYFAVPDANRVLFVGAGDVDLDDFRVMVAEAHDEAPEPLSASVFAFERGRLVADPL